MGSEEPVAPEAIEVPATIVDDSDGGFVYDQDSAPEDCTVFGGAKEMEAF
jgi:hypothetical protein